MSSSSTPVIKLMKILVVGSPATGKTSLIKRYALDEFNAHETTTVGTDFLNKQEIIEKAKVSIQLWDIAGQERFVGLSRLFYTHGVGALVVFDIFDRETFNKILLWKKDLDSKLFLSNGAPIPVLLLGNKCDMISSSNQRVVTQEEMDQAAKQHNFYLARTVSAKSGENVKEAVGELVHHIYQLHKEMREAKTKDSSASSSSSSSSSSDSSSSSVKLTEQNSSSSASSSGGCC
eukprot:TRINITY_DN2771_c0_g1_i1.p1 TRINITY_DN2771_c0_g1~~TRINITY_DN2771_c0_g1_i1.p1  ORF type:complete len:233 (-),score=80.44 TRINITY_DN2771_c0_g1_i1:201-899(-)